jgi:hypothetical protein
VRCREGASIAGQAGTRYRHAQLRARWGVLGSLSSLGAGHGTTACSGCTEDTLPPTLNGSFAAGLCADMWRTLAALVGSAPRHDGSAVSQAASVCTGPKSVKSYLQQSFSSHQLGAEHARAAAAAAAHLAPQARASCNASGGEHANVRHVQCSRSRMR